MMSLITRCAGRTAFILAIFASATPAIAQSNLSDITGPNLVSPPSPAFFESSGSGSSNPNPNLSDVTGPNLVSPPSPEIFESNDPGSSNPNLSDVTGPDPNNPGASKVTSAETTNSARARRAASVGFSESDVQRLADDIGAAYQICAGGGDCAGFNTLYEQSQEILQVQ